MTIGGWIIMLISITTVTYLMGWCIYKVLTTPGEADHLKGIDTHTPDQYIDNNEN